MVTALVKVVDSFIQQMNGWEKFCNHLDEYDLDENSICLQQTSRLEDIFIEFCTAKENEEEFIVSLMVAMAATITTQNTKSASLLKLKKRKLLFIQNGEYHLMISTSIF